MKTSHHLRLALLVAVAALTVRRLPQETGAPTTATSATGSERPSPDGFYHGDAQLDKPRRQFCARLADNRCYGNLD